MLTSDTYSGAASLLKALANEREGNHIRMKPAMPARMVKPSLHDNARF
ncbi:MAG: hypothetical protein LBJ41_03035 [Treponema sp.]|nr:hypothetical protein [Treponema sp.]